MCSNRAKARVLATVCMFLLVTLCGCCGIKIIDSETDRYRLIRAGQWREVVARVDAKNGVFYTLVGEGGHAAGLQDYLLCRKFDFEGNIVEVKKIPMDPKLRYCDPAYVLLSPDGKTIVHFDFRTDRLSCFNFATGESRQFTNGLKANRISMLDMEFVGQNEVMLFLEEYDKELILDHLIVDDRVERAKIYKVNLNTGVITEWYTPVSLTYLAVKYSSGKIAFQEGNSKHDIHGCIKVMDVNSGRVIQSIKEDGLFTDFEFNPDGSKIVYGVENQQKICDLSTGKSELIGTLGENQLSYYIAFLDEHHIMYHMNPEAGGGIFVRNIRTGAVEKEIKAKVFGNFYAVDGGKKIIVPVN